MNRKSFFVTHSASELQVKDLLLLVDPQLNSIRKVILKQRHFPKDHPRQVFLRIE